MSDDQNLDLLAAEYVLGSLEDEERREAERLLASDAAFADSVAAWQQRLTPLVAHVAPAPPPPDLWQRIEANIAPTARVVPFRLRVRVWQAATGGALTLAAGLAAVMLLPHRERPDQPDRKDVAEQSQILSASPIRRADSSEVRAPVRSRMAMLSPMAGGPPALMAKTDKDGGLVVWPTGSLAVPDDKDLELWALPQGETRPRSLGLLPPSGTTVTTALAPNTQLLVSLEPKGGSPTGQPTGPMLYGGWLTTIELPRG
jgi:anti-sigma-K factor RskA